MQAFIPAGILLSLCLTGCSQFASDTARIAVATNFQRPLLEIVEHLERTTPHRYTLSSGSTGKLFAQIQRGAPFDVFFAADQERPRRLVQDGLVSPASRHSYAAGRLMFWTARSAATPEWLQSELKTGTDPIAIANERLAPYGAAALTLLEAQYPESLPRLLRGENAGHAFTLVATGHASIGLVAAASVVAHGEGTSFPIDEGDYPPILQDVVVLPSGAGHPAVTALMSWFRKPEAAGLLERWGYRVPES